MATTIDRLQIEINTQATKANTAIDNLITRLDRLTTSLGKINSSSINRLANGVDRLGKAMQTMNGVKTSDFTRLAKNISKMGSVNTQALNSTASSLSHITRAFNNLGSVSSNSVQMAELAKSMSKLGGVNVQRAITNIPQLATALNNLMVTLSRSPRVSDNVIRLTNSLARLASQGGKVGTSSRSLQNSLNSTNIAVKKARVGFTGLASTIGRLYASYFWVKRIFDALKKSITSTADYIEAYNYFTVAFGKIASEWDSDWENYGSQNAQNYSNKFVSKMNETFKTLSGVSYDPKTGLLSETGLKNLGLNIQEVTQYAAQLGSMMNSVGQTGETTLATTQAFVRLAGDISSLYNIDYSTAASNIQSIMQGQSRVGYKYGWDTTVASLQALADEYDLSKPVSEMTQMEKQQLRILKILRDSRVAWGDQANTIGTLANQVRLLKGNFSQLGMSIGQLFSPIVTKILPVVNGLVIALRNLFLEMASFLGVSNKNIGAGFLQDDKENSEDLAENIESATDALKEYKNQLMGFDEINKLQEDDKSSKNGLGGSIDLTDEILKATSEYEKVWQQAYDRMENDAEKWAQRISKKLQPIKKLFQDIAIGDWFAVGQDVSNLTAGIYHYFSDAIDKVDWKQVGENIGDYLEGIDWYKVITEGIKLKFEIGKAIAEVWFSSFDTAPIETSVITALATLKFTGLGKLLSSKIATTITGSAFVVTLTKALKKYKTPIIKYTVTLLVAAISIKVAQNGLEPIFSEYDLNEIKEASEEMFNDWFGKNKFSLTLSDMFVVSSTAIAEPKEIISALKKLWKDVCSGDFKFTLFNLFEFPSYNEISDALQLMFRDIDNGEFKYNFLGLFDLPSYNDIKYFLIYMWNDIKNGDFKFNFLGLFELPSWNELKSALSRMWNDIKSGDFKFSFLGLFNFPSWNDMKSAIKQMWTDILNGDFKFSFLGLFEFPSFNDLVNAFKKPWNEFADWLNEQLTWEIPAMKNPFTGKNITQKYTFDLGNIPKFATGGFPEDGLFMANHNELVGQFSNGQTVVANNEQIIAGIQSGVYEAVLSAMNNANQGTQGDIVVQIDGKKVFQAVRKQHNNYLMQTGKNAFA